VTSNTQRWLQLLDVFTAWGEASARNGTPLPTEDQLWAEARRGKDPLVGEQIDPALLAELRDAFNDGRQPTRIDLQAVADAVTHRGHRAYVEQTGGNTATIYAGRQVPDRYGEPRWSAVAGPGWFEGPGWTKPFADTSEFHVGPDGDDTWCLPVPAHTTAAVVADLIVAVIDEVNARRARFAEAAQTARDAMWQAFAAKYPEVTTGDLAPGTDHDFVRECDKILAGWLDDNWPLARTAPQHLTATDAADRDDRPPQ
jgi:hypothetical protein